MPQVLTLRCERCLERYITTLNGGQRVPTLCEPCRELNKKALAAARVKKHRVRHHRGINK